VGKDFPLPAETLKSRCHLAIERLWLGSVLCNHFLQALL